MRQNSETIMVSICCITYNQKEYIRDALEGFLSQKTNFSYEVLIHDDASTDGTAEIIADYGARFPDIIKPVLQTENQYAKGFTNISGTYNFPRAKGKYIAMCEGMTTGPARTSFRGRWITWRPTRAAPWCSTAPGWRYRGEP